MKAIIELYPTQEGWRAPDPLNPNCPVCKKNDKVVIEPEMISGNNLNVSFFGLFGGTRYEGKAYVCARCPMLFFDDLDRMTVAEVK